MEPSEPNTFDKTPSPIFDSSEKINKTLNDEAKRKEEQVGARPEENEEYIPIGPSPCYWKTIHAEFLRRHPDWSWSFEIQSDSDENEDKNSFAELEEPEFSFERPGKLNDDLFLKENENKIPDVTLSDFVETQYSSLIPEDILSTTEKSVGKVPFEYLKKLTDIIQSQEREINEMKIKNNLQGSTSVQRNQGSDTPSPLLH